MESNDQQFRSRVRAISERRLNLTDVESAEQLAPTTLCESQPHGARTSRKARILRNTVSDTSRSSYYDRRFLFYDGASTDTRFRGWKTASYNCSDDQGRRVADPSQEARIQSSRASIR